MAASNSAAYRWRVQGTAGKLRSRKEIVAQTTDMPEEAVMNFDSDFLRDGATLPEPNPPTGDEIRTCVLRNPQSPSAVGLRIFFLAAMAIALACLHDVNVA